MATEPAREWLRAAILAAIRGAGGTTRRAPTTLKKYRFPKGQSGNPGGRPKRIVRLETQRFSRG